MAFDSLGNQQEKATDLLIPLTRGRYVARTATCAADVAAAQALRAQCFGLGALPDSDVIDTRATHVLIEERTSGTLVCCFRLLAVHGADLPNCYAARYYGLNRLQSFDGLMMELGRFCVHPDWREPDILRLAWAAMTQVVDARDVQLLFGCSSFVGVETAPYLDAFAMLKARYLAPARWSPKVKAPDVFRYAAQLRHIPDAKKAMATLPPLLRSYLLMGGRVSDHAVVDHRMNTLHVFTGVEIGAIPAARKRLLRALA